jgi:hypothetical protein
MSTWDVDYPYSKTSKLHPADNHIIDTVGERPRRNFMPAYNTLLQTQFDSSNPPFADPLGSSSSPSSPSKALTSTKGFLAVPPQFSTRDRYLYTKIFAESKSKS